MLRSCPNPDAIKHDTKEKADDEKLTKEQLLENWENGYFK